ncbi:Fc.00g082580.m01.CDS01 [Cosmosporella sp. VM-42]
MTPERYKRWIDLIVQGNQNMLRVWGGGICEDESFYEECDRRGILVWQDFCFACGQYPSDDEFVVSLKEEAVQAIERLRSHPSLAIWAGNNEDCQIANKGLKHDMSMPAEKWSASTFGARVTYEKILPDLVQKYSPRSLYWPGSPLSGVGNNGDRTIGDVHLWNVSSGMLLPYQRYPDITGRFMSEFGMMSCPAMTTVFKSFFGGSTDFHPQSKEFEFHYKASSYEKRMFTCIGENFRMSFDLKTYVYLSQLTQSEAMYYGFRGWRR